MGAVNGGSDDRDMKLAIIGSRTANDYNVLTDAVRGRFGFRIWHDGRYIVTEIISGGAAGADSLGARLARECGIKLTEYLPDWEAHGKRAGFIRNQTIIENADIVLALWDGVSKGTGHSLYIAKRLKKTTFIVYV